MIETFELNIKLSLLKTKLMANQLIVFKSKQIAINMKNIIKFLSNLLSLLLIERSSKPSLITYSSLLLILPSLTPPLIVIKPQFDCYLFQSFK
jgi:hypothetical protein